MPRIANRPQTQTLNHAPVAVLDSPAEPSLFDEPPAPKVKSAPAPPSRQKSEAAARLEADLRDAETALIRQADGERLDPDAEFHLAFVYPDQFELDAQKSRVARMRKFQRLAGSVADRQNAKSYQDQTAAQMAAQGPKRRQAIEDAQRDLAALERAADQARAAVEKHETAIHSLLDPTLLNNLDRAVYERGRRDWEANYGSPARVARQTAAGLLEKAGWDAANDDEKLATYSQSKPTLNHLATERLLPTPTIRQPGQENVRDKRHIRVDVRAWQQHAAELRAAAEKLLTEAADLETAGEQARQELDQMLRSLVPD